MKKIYFIIILILLSFPARAGIFDLSRKFNDKDTVALVNITTTDYIRFSNAVALDSVLYADTFINQDSWTIESDTINFVGGVFYRPDTGLFKNYQITEMGNFVLVKDDGASPTRWILVSLIGKYQIGEITLYFRRVR